MMKGTCLCGTVQYELAQPLSMMMHCHCSMCRKHHGASFATFVAAPFAAFSWIAGADAVARYPSSEHGVRSYCRRCGSVAPLLMPEAGFAVAPAGNLDGDPGIRPFDRPRGRGLETGRDRQDQPGDRARSRHQ